MYKIKIYDKNNKQKCKLVNLSCANTYIKRLLGLMGKSKFNGLIFKQKSHDRISGCIHTCFMKVPIDLIYINNEMTIKETKTLKSWKLYIPKKGNIKYIIELPENTIIKYDIQVNDKTVISHEKEKN